MTNNEKILCAAIWYKDVTPRAVHRPINTPGGVVVSGFRHGHCISQIVPLTVEEAQKYCKGKFPNVNVIFNRYER